jgi:tetratricopeptide (TPR) repeat protein
MKSSFGFMAIAISTIHIATIHTIAIAKPVSNLNQIAAEVSVRVAARDSYGRESVGAIVKKDRDLYSVLVYDGLDRETKQIVTYDGQKHLILGIDYYSGSTIVKFRSSNNYRVVTIGSYGAIGKNDDIYTSGYKSGKIFVQSNRFISNDSSAFYYDNSQYDPQHNNKLIFNKQGELIGFHLDDKWSIDDEHFWPQYDNYPYPTVNSLEQIYANSQWMPDVCGNYYRSIKRRITAGRTRYHTGRSIQSLNLPTKKLGMKVKVEQNIHLQSIKNKDNFTIPKTMTTFNLAGTETIAELDRLISLDPQDSTSLFLRSNLKTKNEDYRGALADLDRLVALQPNSSAVHYYRGYLKQHYLKDFPGALADYDRLVELNPNDSKVYLNRGLLQEQDIQNFQAALVDYNRLLEMERIPKIYPSTEIERTAPIYYFIARLKAEKMKDFAGALADYDRVIRENNINHLIYQQRAEVKAQLKDLNGALADYNFAVNMHTSVSPYNSIQTIQNRQVVRAKFKVNYLNDLAGAFVDYNQAVELEPSGETYYERGIFLSTYRKDRAAAKADFQKAIELLNEDEYKSGTDLELLKKVKLALAD